MDCQAALFRCSPACQSKQKLPLCKAYWPGTASVLEKLGTITILSSIVFLSSTVRAGDPNEGEQRVVPANGSKWVCLQPWITSLVLGVKMVFNFSIFQFSKWKWSFVFFLAPPASLFPLFLFPFSSLPPAPGPSPAACTSDLRHRWQAAGPHR